jgi:hypothetical protein
MAPNEQRERAKKPRITRPREDNLDVFLILISITS